MVQKNRYLVNYKLKKVQGVGFSNIYLATIGKVEGERSSPIFNSQLCMYGALTKLFNGCPKFTTKLNVLIDMSKSEIYNGKYIQYQ